MESQQQTCDYQEQAESEAEAEEEPVAKGKKKRVPKGTKSAEPRIKWSSKEDECLAEA